MLSQLTQLRNLVEHLGFSAEAAQPATTLPLTELALPLQRALALLGLPGLARRQLQFCQLAAEGRHCALDRIGSGVALQLALLQAWIDAPQRRFLWLCPDQKSAHRRLQSLRRLARAAGLPAHQIEIFAPEAGAPHPQVLVIDAESLHRAFLPKHLGWSSWWEALALVVVDDASAYTGVRGSHVCNVLHRLQRIAGHYGCRPTWLADFEPVANPLELLRKLLPVETRLLAAGAPCGGWQLRLPAREIPGPLERAARRLGRSVAGALPEACLKPEHLVIRASQLKCAAYELPLELDEPLGADGLSAYFEAARTLKREGDRLYWVGVDAPASAVRLNEVGPGMQLFDAPTRRPLARVDRIRGLEQIFPGAVYLHDERAWLVEEVDFERREAYLRPAVVASLSACEVDIEARFPAQAALDTRGSYAGEVELTLRVARAGRRCPQTGRLLESAAVSRPPELLITRCVALALGDEAPVSVDAADEVLLETLAELLRLALFSLVRCEPAARFDPEQTGSSLGHTRQSLAGRPVLVLFDAVPDGSGLCGLFARRLDEVLALAGRYLGGCGCGPRGCTACVGAGSDPGLKPRLQQLLEDLGRGKHEPSGDPLRCL